MSSKEKINELLLDFHEMLENDDIEEALTLLCMIKNAEQLDEWMADK